MKTREPHPLAGKVVKLSLKGKYPPDIPEGSKFLIEDWCENVFGRSWMDSTGNPAAINYAVRSGLVGLPLDNEVVYGKVNHIGHLVHISELRMTTAREKAREAAFKCITPFALETTEAAADAASDVWEPLVRGLLEVIDSELNTYAPSYSIIIEAKEALGYADS